MLGGTDADVAAASEVLSAVASRITHCGPSGAGQTVKLLNQIIVGTAMTGLAEVSALVRANGLDPEVVRQALSGGRADSPLLQEFFVKFASADPTSPDASATWSRISTAPPAPAARLASRCR